MNSGIMQNITFIIQKSIELFELLFCFLYLVSDM